MACAKCCMVWPDVGCDGAWRAAAPRRTVLFRFSPANSAFSIDYSPAWDAASFGDLTDHQRAVLEPPSHRASGRPILPY